jgi:hypothetical protein
MIVYTRATDDDDVSEKKLRKADKFHTHCLIASPASRLGLKSVTESVTQFTIRL